MRTYLLCNYSPSFFSKKIVSVINYHHEILVTLFKLLGDRANPVGLGFSGRGEVVHASRQFPKLPKPLAFPGGLPGSKVCLYIVKTCYLVNMIFSAALLDKKADF